MGGQENGFISETQSLFTFQATGFLAGYLARWSGNKEIKGKNSEGKPDNEPNQKLGHKSCNVVMLDSSSSPYYNPQESLAPWIFMISNGGLTVPTNQFLLDVEKMDQAFNEFHGIASFDKGTMIIDRFTEKLVSLFAGKCDNP